MGPNQQLADTAKVPITMAGPSGYIPLRIENPSLRIETCPSSCVSTGPGFHVPVWAHVVTGTGTSILIIIVIVWLVGKWRRS